MAFKYILMNCLQQSLDTLRWFISISKKFFVVLPLNTLVVVFSTIVSQVSVILAFFLPLKIIILLGSEGIPRYFPQSWAAYDRDQLVIYLCLAMILFYLLHHVAEKAIGFYSDLGARTMLTRTGKLLLFANQEEKAISAYVKYSESLAALVFIFLGMVFLLFLYPLLAAAMFAFISLVALIIGLGVVLNARFRQAWEDGSGQLLGTLSGFGFFWTFAVIVLDFILGSPPGFILVIISMLLSRQLLGRSKVFIDNLKKLYSDRLSINALFFHGHAYKQDSGKHKKQFWSLLDREQRKVWITRTIARLSGTKIHTLDTCWRQSGTANVACFEVSCFNQSNEKTGKFLVKLFNPARKALAMHESNLLGIVKSKNFPAPAFQGADQIDNCICHVFNWSSCSLSPKEKFKKEALNIRIGLMEFPVPDKLYRQYIRSKQMLWQRLDQELPRCLHAGANYLEEQKLVDRLEQELPRITSILKSLPLQFVNPDIKVETLARNSKKGLLLINWGRWSLEPLGSGWPVKPIMLKKLDQAVEETSRLRKDCQDVRIEQVRLAALMFAVESFYHKQNFSSAIGLLPEVLDCLGPAGRL